MSEAETPITSEDIMNALRTVAAESIAEADEQRRARLGRASSVAIEDFLNGVDPETKPNITHKPDY